MKTYTTSQIAQIVGIHPNTVRLYEEWGHISPVPRKANGYRIFTEKHLEEIKIARLALPGPYPVSSKPLFAMLKAFINQAYRQALDLVQEYKNLVLEEKKRSKDSLKILDQWYKGQYGTDRIIAIGRKEFADLNRVSVETLRTWERNNLYQPAVNTRRYKQYSELDYEKVQIIRLLRKTGFSVASLAQMFHTKQTRHLPSYFLAKIYQNNESTYEADQWLNHLDQHLKRANELLGRITLKIK